MSEIRESDLTAYALGELDDEATIAAIEAALAIDADKRALVEAIRSTAAQLTSELAAESNIGLDQVRIDEIVARPAPRPRRQPRRRWWSHAAVGIAAAAAGAGAMLMFGAERPAVEDVPTTIPKVVEPARTPEPPPTPPTEPPKTRPFAMAPKLVATRATAPMSLTASDGSGLRLVSLEVKGVVVEPLAMTELHLDFENPEDRVREGRFSIALPPGASVRRFAMKIGNHWQEGEVVERRRAQRVYESFLHRGQDPALLEHSAGNEFSARVFPIPARGRKKIIISYSHELRTLREPYRVPLRGLPKIDRFMAHVAVDGEIFKQKKSGWVPDKDFEAPVPHVQGRLGLRNRNLVVARITPVPETALDPVGSLLLLVDTSASRALGIDAQIDLVDDLVGGVRNGAGGATKVAVAAFDQRVNLVYEGTAAGFTDEHVDTLRKRGALGASNLEAALEWAAKREHRYARVVLITDGIPTAGATEGDRLVSLARDLGRAEVERLDAIVVGGIRDEALLRRMTAAGLDRTGVVIDGNEDRALIGARLSSKTYGNVRVKVQNARWVWPEKLDGLQSADEVLIYADLPRDEPFVLELDGLDMMVDERKLAQTPRALLERAWVKARIDRLLHQRDTLSVGDADLRAALKSQIIELSTKHDVLSPFTAMLVLETEADYRRFGIARDANENVLRIEDGNVATTELPPVRAPAANSNRALRKPKLQLQWQERRKRATRSMRARERGARRVPPPPPPAPPPTRRPNRLVEDDMLEAVPRRRRPAPNALQMPLRQQLDDAQVLAVLRKNRNAVRDCIKRHATSDDEWSGTLTVKMVIRKTGRPSDVRILPMSAKDTVAGKCLVEATSKFRFPKFDGPSMPIDFPVHVRGPGFQEPRREPPPPPPPPPPTPRARPDDDPWPTMTTGRKGRLRDITSLIARKKLDRALQRALAWRSESPGDVLALVALGEAFEAIERPADAARAYGSIVDLFPSRPQMRRFAGNLLERIGDEHSIGMAVDTYEKSIELRPDHATGYRLLAYAQLRAGRPKDGFVTLVRQKKKSHRAGRFGDLPKIVAEDLGVMAAAWVNQSPEDRALVESRLAEIGGVPIRDRTVRFVLTWETDANDVDLHVKDRGGEHVSFRHRAMRSGGKLTHDVQNGYGPEAFVVTKPRAYPYGLAVHYYEPGPMGYGMGMVHIVHTDKKGAVRVEARPFVVMEAKSYVDLGVVQR